jgi:hypothetical protein
MKTRRNSALPSGLEKVRQRFERWRQRRAVGTRIPDSLWAAAVEAAESWGICQTAKVLRLDYYSLKRRLERKIADGNRQADGVPAAAFVELSVPAAVASRECTVEPEDRSGAKMRIHLRGVEIPDVVALCRSFRELEP